MQKAEVTAERTAELWAGEAWELLCAEDTFSYARARREDIYQEIQLAVLSIEGTHTLGYYRQAGINAARNWQRAERRERARRKRT